MARPYVGGKQPGQIRTFYDILLAGETGCGKTSLWKRYVKDTFSEEHIETFRLSRVRVTKEIKGYDHPVTLILGDCDGKKKYEIHSFNYYQMMDAVFILFDMSKEGSLGDISDMLDAAKRYNDACIVLVGTKSDKDPAINTSEAQDFAKKNDLMFFETSAKTGHNINELFTEVVHKLVALFGMQKPPLDNPKQSESCAIKTTKDVTVADNKGCNCVLS